MANSSSAKQHIEEIRRVKFSIGGEPNPLTEDLHHAVRNLSAELYTKDVHFLMELIQNAEDNEYCEGVDITLEFVVTSKDITRTGASATLLVLNNEVGFSRKNIDSICSVGRSTKKGKRQEGFVGEKGIGFKSVFVVTSQPYIFSNGYQIKFTEEPSSECNIGYIVPHWVDSNPTISDIHGIYGFDKELPTTVIVLPLKCEKISTVEKQLSNLHPEILLFLSKIKRVSICESKDDPALPDSVSAISIISEKEFGTRKDINADSHILFLSAEEGRNGAKDECNYYMWRQRFPVKDENRVDARKEIDEWMISLAFPFGVRLKRGCISAGIYAFLPTEMVTNFPFIIQADFLLTSSREAIRLDNKWNKGILDCVSSAFVSALASLAKSVGTAPVSSIVNMFEFLPIQKSPSPELEVVREAIKAKIQSKTIMPCDTFSEQLVFCRPYEAARILPDFREILFKLKKQGALINWISFQGQYILHSDVDLTRFEEAFRFLGIQFVNYNWYARCIQECDLVLEANDDIYLDLLHFLADNWCKGFAGTAMEDIPLVKYVDQHGITLLCSVSAAAMGSKRNLSFAWDPKQHSWINKWNMEFRCMKNLYMLPNSTAASLSGFTRSYSLYTWLKLYAGIKATDVRDFASFMLDCVLSSRDRNLVLSFTHFIYHSLSKEHITTDDVIKISHRIPVINKYSTVTAVRTSILAPASGSNWEKLIGSNCFFGENYVELGGDYLLPCYFAGEYTSENELKGFIDDYLKPLDLPSLQPPDVELPVASSLLSKERALVLLDWIDNLRNMSTLKDNRFLRSVKEGKWLKTCSGCSSPNRSFISDKEAENIFSELGAVSFDSYIIDEQFYDCKIGAYKKVLKLVGVKHGLKGTCEIIAEHFTSICSSQLNKNEVLYLLSFIRFSKLNRHLTEGFIENIKNGQWLKSTQGYRTPLGSVYLSSGEQENLSQVANLPFIDELFYGNEIGGYVSELKLLGVVVDLDYASSLTANSIAHRLTSIDSNSQLSKEEVISTLGFIRYLKVNKELTDDLLNPLKLGKWLKTNQGYRRPLRTVYLPHETEALSQVDNLPIVDNLFYGDEIGGYKEELKMLGVLVSVDQVYALVANHIPLPPYPSCLTRNNGILILKCVRNVRFDDVFLYKIRSKPWLKTKLGYKCPTESILSDSNWDCISHIVEAPFIDESFYGSGIRSFKDEFRRVGVAVEYIC